MRDGGGFKQPTKQLIHLPGKQEDVVIKREKVLASVLPRQLQSKAGKATNGVVHHTQPPVTQLEPVLQPQVGIIVGNDHPLHAGGFEQAAYHRLDVARPFVAEQDDGRLRGTIRDNLDGRETGIPLPPGEAPEVVRKG